MAASFLLKGLALALAGSFIEDKFLPQSLEFLTEPSTAVAGLPRGFGLTVLVLCFSYFWLLAHGMSVGSARSKYIALAKKDGEKDVEERYALPNLYAQGTSKHVRAFNCVQRSHQQILETFPGYLLTSLVAAVGFPLFSALLCALWLKSRMDWVAGYVESEGDVAKRYGRAFSGFFWNSMLALFFMSVMTSVNVLAGGEKAVFWDMVSF
jgi:hypothetical protein